MKPVGPLPQSFTTKYNGIARTLISDVVISPAFDPAKIKKPEHYPAGKKYKAIWDTGATSSVITAKVVLEIGLKPIGMTKVSTASGMDISPIFIVNILLPNRVAVIGVKVTQGKLAGNVEALIGMDIIVQGDFCITNYNGTTTMSFRIPSQEHTDYVAAAKSNNRVKISRNAPCPCGSGKKYKMCCGRK